MPSCWGFQLCFSGFRSRAENIGISCDYPLDNISTIETYISLLFGTELRALFGQQKWAVFWPKIAELRGKWRKGRSLLGGRNRLTSAFFWYLTEPCGKNLNNTASKPEHFTICCYNLHFARSNCDHNFKILFGSPQTKGRDEFLISETSFLPDKVTRLLEQHMWRIGTVWISTVNRYYSISTFEPSQNRTTPRHLRYDG